MADETGEASANIVFVPDQEMKPVPDFLRISEPKRYFVLANSETPVTRLIQSPISMQELMQEATKLGPLSKVMLIVPQNPEGF